MTVRLATGTFPNDLPGLAVPAGDAASADAMFGDGSAIDDRAMREVRGAHWRNETYFRWQSGDLLLIDNLIVGHGRQPFCGPRRILAALGGSMSP